MAKKTRKPLTISIQGNGLDIFAKIRDTDLADILTRTLQRAQQAPASPGEALLKARIATFLSSLQPAQIKTIKNALGADQFAVLMDILNLAKA